MTGGVDESLFRQAFGRFATGVAVLTTRWQGLDYAMTANSLTSVSLDPPLLLVCPGRNAASLSAIRHTGLFGVSVLSSAQRDVAERFATRGVDRFSHGEWVESESGVLLLEGACANFACSLANDIEAGDHQVLIGRIESFRSAGDRNPLMYLRGGYA